MKNRFFIILLLIVLTVSCTKEVFIPVIVTTDIHGAFEGLASVSAEIGRNRNENNNLILLDNGDFIQGTPMLYYFNNVKTDELNPASVAMNFMKYDAVNIGNHDMEAGFPVYKKIEKELSAPLICANITELKTQQTLFKPYTVITRDKKRIAVLALTTSGTAKSLKPEEKLSTIVEPMLRSAEKWIAVIKEKEQPDAIIGLFHEGIDISKEIAKKVDGFDVIFTGHDHLEHNITVTNQYGKKVLILGSHDRADSFAKAQIAIKGSKRTVTGGIIKTGKIKDEGLISALKKHIELSEQYELSVTAETASQLNDFVVLSQIHRTLKKITGAEITITAPVAKDIAIPAGKLTNSDLFRIYPFDNNPVTISLTGLEIRKLLQYSSELQLTESKYKRFYNNLSAIYSVPVPLEDSRSYTVAMNSYHASDGGSMLSIGAGLSEAELNSRIIKIYPENIRENLFKN